MSSALAPRLLVLTELGLAPREVWIERSASLARAARAGSVLVVLRDKDRSARVRLEFGAALAAALRAEGQLFGVAERIDIALLLGADALHLGEHSVETRDARRLLPPGCFVTRACHELARCASFDADANADADADADANAVVLSPIMSARKGNLPLGLSALTSCRRELERSGRLLYALGGVDASNAAACLAAGAHGVAMMGGVLQDEPEALVAALGIARKL